MSDSKHTTRSSGGGSKRSRSAYENKPEVRLKRYIKNHDPNYMEKRKKYSQQPEVLARRHTLNKRRRQLCSTLIHLIKSDNIAMRDGTKIDIVRGRLVRQGNGVIRVDSQGKIKYLAYEDELDLEKAEYDQVVELIEDAEYNDLIEKYKSGNLAVKYTPKDNIRIDVIAIPIGGGGSSDSASEANTASVSGSCSGSESSG